MMRVLLAALALCPCLGAQDEAPSPVAIVGARIIVDPNTTIESGTVVLRDGMIAAVGADAVAPVDAEVIDGKGLTVYAGFIDGHTTIGLPPTKRTDEQRRIAEGAAVDFTRDALAGMESANRKGVRPELAASELAVIGADDLKKWHAGGFAAAAIAAGEEYWSGRGCFAVLSGAPRRTAFIRPRTGMYAAFKSYGEGYPTTIMGALAHIRQTLLDARHYRELHERYAKKPEGRRPPVDPSLEALGEVLDRKPTVFFDANSPTEISRALALSDEFGFPVAIVGGAEAWKVADLLKGRAPVVLSLKWPKDPGDEKKKDADEIEEDRPPKLREHEKARWEERVRCALKLHEAGVTFCFSTQGIGPGDLLEKVEKLVERGLPRATAVSALTAAPAALFGVETQLGRVAVGRSASLTVLSGQLGDKKAKVRYVFADGVKVDLEKRKAEVDVTGAWTVKAKGLEATLDLKQSGADVTGTLKTPKGEGAVTGKVSGRTLEVRATIADARYEFSGDFKNKKLSGTFSGPEGKDVEWSATKPE
jgi:imidazolonepropionase-like amidohydrolase